jgi:NTE family protein|nr:patatin-like phospholipase family protein [Halanaerobium salsuginis]
MLLYGLVLEGGGAKGAYHIGALKALTELKIKVSAVAGTSIGAMNGAMYVQGKLDLAYEYWNNISTEKVLNIDDQQLTDLFNLSVNQNNLFYFINKVKQVFKNKGLDNSFFQEILLDNIDEDLLRASSLDFAIITLSLSELKPLELFLDDIPAGKVRDYIMASAYLPAFKLQRIDGQLLIDGGFYENLPIKTLLKRGYNKIIAIRTYGLGKIEKKVDSEKEIIFINPSENLGRMLNFSQANARKNIKMGYYDTLKYFKHLQGNKYYLKLNQNEDYFLDFLLKINPDIKINLLKKFSYPEAPLQRSFLENLIPKLAEILDFDYPASYSEIVIALLEKLAAAEKIDRFQIYTFAELLDLVCQKNKPAESILYNKLPSFIKTSNFLPKQLQDDLLLDIAEKIFIKTGGRNADE